MAFDVDKWMVESGYDVLDTDVPMGDVSKVKVNIKRPYKSMQDMFCHWLSDGRWYMEPSGYRLFEETFHVTPAGPTDKIVARICEEYKKGNVKLERRTKKFFRERFGVKI